MSPPPKAQPLRLVKLFSMYPNTRINGTRESHAARDEVLGVSSLDEPRPTSQPASQPGPVRLQTWRWAITMTFDRGVVRY